MGDAHRQFRLVDVLAAGARGAIDVDPAIAFIDVDDDAVVDDRIDPDRGEAGVAARVRIERRDAHETMHAQFRLHPAMRVVALDDQRRRFDPRFVAGRLFDDLDLEFAALGPAHVHAQQHARPVAAFGAAGARMDFDIGVVAVRLARQQRLELAPLALGLQPLEDAEALLLGGRSPSISPSSTSVAASSMSRCILASAPSRSSSMVRSRISFCAASGSFHRPESSALAFSSARRRVAASTSKMPPQQPHGLLDVFDKGFGFGAHGGLSDGDRESGRSSYRSRPARPLLPIGAPFKARRRRAHFRNWAMGGNRNWRMKLGCSCKTRKMSGAEIRRRARRKSRAHGPQHPLGNAAWAVIHEAGAKTPGVFASIDPDQCAASPLS